jgi:hypothetical protein
MSSNEKKNPSSKQPAPSKTARRIIITHPLTASTVCAGAGGSIESGCPAAM